MAGRRGRRVGPPLQGRSAGRAAVGCRPCWRGTLPSGRHGRVTVSRSLPLSNFRGVAQPGRAPRLGRGGPRFESGRPDLLVFSPQVRDADPQRDAAACADIYAPYVADSVATFEEQAPTAAAMSARIAAAHVWLVAEDAGGVIGYAYGSQHRERA